MQRLHLLVIGIELYPLVQVGAEILFVFLLRQQIEGLGLFLGLIFILLVQIGCSLLGGLLGLGPLDM